MRNAWQGTWLQFHVSLILFLFSKNSSLSHHKTIDSRLRILKNLLAILSNPFPLCLQFKLPCPPITSFLIISCCKSEFTENDVGRGQVETQVWILSQSRKSCCPFWEERVQSYWPTTRQLAGHLRSGCQIEGSLWMVVAHKLGTAQWQLWWLKVHLTELSQNLKSSH